MIMLVLLVLSTGGDLRFLYNKWLLSGIGVFLIIILIKSDDRNQFTR